MSQWTWMIKTMTYCPPKTQASAVLTSTQLNFHLYCSEQTYFWVQQVALNWSPAHAYTHTTDCFLAFSLGSFAWWPNYAGSSEDIQADRRNVLKTIRSSLLRTQPAVWTQGFINARLPTLTQRNKDANIRYKASEKTSEFDSDKHVMVITRGLCQIN